MRNVATPAIFLGVHARLELLRKKFFLNQACSRRTSSGDAGSQFPASGSMVSGISKSQNTLSLTVKTPGRPLMFRVADADTNKGPKDWTGRNKIDDVAGSVDDYVEMLCEAGGPVRTDAACTQARRRYTETPQIFPVTKTAYNLRNCGTQIKMYATGSFTALPLFSCSIVLSLALMHASKCSF